MSGALDEFLAGSPLPQRAGLRLVLEIYRRPRGASFLTSMPMLAQAAGSLTAMAAYDDPEVSKRLGYDAEAVVARGRELRRREGRP